MTGVTVEFVTSGIFANQSAGTKLFASRDDKEMPFRRDRVDGRDVECAARDLR